MAAVRAAAKAAPARSTAAASSLRHACEVDMPSGGMGGEEELEVGCLVVGGWLVGCYTRSAHWR